MEDFLGVCRVQVRDTMGRKPSPRQLPRCVGDLGWVTDERTQDAIDGLHSSLALVRQRISVCKRSHHVYASKSKRLKSSSSSRLSSSQCEYRVCATQYCSSRRHFLQSGTHKQGVMIDPVGFFGSNRLHRGQNPSSIASVAEAIRRRRQSRASAVATSSGGRSGSSSSSSLGRITIGPGTLAARARAFSRHVLRYLWVPFEVLIRAILHHFAPSLPSPHLISRSWRGSADRLQHSVCRRAAASPHLRCEQNGVVQAAEGAAGRRRHPGTPTLGSHQCRPGAELRQRGVANGVRRRPSGPSNADDLHRGARLGELLPPVVGCPKRP